MDANYMQPTNYMQPIKMAAPMDVQFVQNRGEQLVPKPKPWGKLFKKRVLRRSLGPNVTKTVLYPDDERDFFEISTPNFRFGRHPNSEYPVTKQEGLEEKAWQQISKYHFVLMKDVTNPNAPIMIKDLSRNGTFLNGILIGQNQTRMIKTNDVISIVEPDIKSEIRRDPPWSGTTTEYEVPDEFLPDVSDDLNMSLLKQVAEDADVSNYLYKTNTSKTTGGDDKEDDSDSEVPSDLLLTSDKIPEIEDEEVTYPSGFSPMDEIPPLPPRSDMKVTYDPFSEGIEFRKQILDDSSDSDDSISRGLNFHDVSLPDASGSGAKGFKTTSSESSSHHELGHLHLPSTTTTTSSHHQQQQPLEHKNNSPTWNIVNNLWDAVNSSVIPTLQSMQQLHSEPAVISPNTDDPGARALQQHRKSVSAELSSDESDFELLDTDDLNINT